MPHKNLQSHPETPEQRKRRLEREAKERDRPKAPITVKPQTVEIIRDQDTGKQIGVTLPSGETFLGLSREEIELFARKEREKVILPEGTQPKGTTQEAFELEQRRIVAGEKERPIKRELDPTLQVGETFPILGPLNVKIQTALLKIGIPKGRGIRDILKGVQKQPEVEPFELQPEELRTLALTEIERIEIERGLTASEQFGSFIEALGVGELQRYVPGAAKAELPSQNVQTVLKTLRILKSRSIDVELKFQKGLLTASAARERLTLIDNELQVGESRMKLLIQGSPELKFNSDGVNFIELKILEVRERLFDSGIAIDIGITATPTDIDILLALKQGVAEEDFEIPS